MRTALVYRNHVYAGKLIEYGKDQYGFQYDKDYLKDDSQQAISLTLPKTETEYKSKFLFPFFYSMLSEGVNKQLQSRQLKIDEKDSFGLLVATAQFDTIGPITVKPAPDEN
jgi:serine/threonine-protein kinase HipA